MTERHDGTATDKERASDVNVPPIDDPESTDASSFTGLYRFATRPQKCVIIIGAIIALICGALQPLNHLLFGDLTQIIIEYSEACLNPNSTNCSVAGDNLSAGIKHFGIWSSINGVAIMITGYLATEAFSYNAIKQVFRVRSLYLQKLLNKDISWFDVHNSGDFSSRMADDLSKFEDGIGEKVPLFLTLQGSFISAITLALVKGWELALICLISLPVSFIAVGLIAYLTTQFSKKELDAYAEAGSIAEEVITSIRTVIGFGGEKLETQRQFFSRYEKNLIFAKDNNIRRHFFEGIGYGMLWLCIFSSYGLAFWYGIKLMLDGNPVYTPGNMLTVFFSVMAGSMSFGSASPFIEAFATAKAAGRKIFHMIKTSPIINQSKNNGAKLAQVRGNIKLQNVKFQYPSRKDVPVLQGIDLEIQAGDTVALVGRYGNRDATELDIVQAAKMANAHQFIKGLPGGYHTLVGERGAQLSGGQKQRIAIARALVRNPAILLLDEATSALDTNSEAKVQAALDRASEHRTTIIVAHRLSTIRGANKIVVISDGKVVEQGTHEDLMELKNEYYALGIKDVFYRVHSSEQFENIGEASEKKIFDSVEDDDEDFAPKRVNLVRMIKVAEINHEALKETDEESEVDNYVKTASLWSIVKLNSPEWLSLFLGCFGAAVMGTVLPIFAVLLGSILQVLQDSDKNYVRQETNKYILYFVLAGVLAMFATFLQLYMFGRAGENLTLRMRSRMFDALLKQEMGYFDRNENGVGSLCAKLSNEASQATGQRIGAIVNSLATLILSVFFAVYYEWRLGLVAMVFVPLIIAATFIQKKQMSQESDDYKESLEKSTKIAVEAVGSIRTVVSLGCEKTFFKLYISELMPHIKKCLRNTHARAFILGFSRAIMIFAFSACLVYGGYLIKHENVQYGVVFKVAQALIMGTVSIANSLAFTPNFEKGLVAARTVMNMINRIPKVSNSQNALIKNTADGNVNYSQIHFSYPTRDSIEVLKGLDLSVLQGKTVALVGPSGCGKSTIIHLLERFYDPASGTVSLDEDDIKSITLASLRSHLGIVSQEPNLFSRSIAENIAYGDNSRHSTDSEIIEAARKANIHNFITQLPEGYNTKLGEKGTQLSGGQKQRIAIARALIRHPKVLLLDEATSALDAESEKVVQDALDNAKQGRTCLTIAHRLTTIQDADLICVVNNGVIVEQGAHTDLIERNGLYYRLYARQHYFL
ncbi:hypothetical protein HUJ05_001197 [Dendroctonus ponderosae]|nr:hypothetical protein HUJ05_001197 [Dendroctonus ponderosae]KAH1027744.1 hypothetical protein HUJ05_001197 [Dendroctonus ponderosae]